jgi:hypothetical protein
MFFSTTPRHARLVESERLQVASFGDPGSSLGHGDIDLFIAGIDLVGPRDESGSE